MKNPPFLAKVLVNMTINSRGVQHDYRAVPAVCH